MPFKRKRGIVIKKLLLFFAVLFAPFGANAISISLETSIMLFEYEAEEFLRKHDNFLLRDKCNDITCIEEGLAEINELHDLMESILNRREEINAKATAKCSDKALSVAIDCSNFATEFATEAEQLLRNPNELGELYTDWERDILAEQIKKCVSFWKNESRLKACNIRANTAEISSPKQIEFQRKALFEAQKLLKKSRDEFEKLRKE